MNGDDLLGQRGARLKEERCVLQDLQEEQVLVSRNGRGTVLRLEQPATVELRGGRDDFCKREDQATRLRLREHTGAIMHREPEALSHTLHEDLDIHVALDRVGARVE